MILLPPTDASPPLACVRQAEFDTAVRILGSRFADVLMNSCSACRPFGCAFGYALASRLALSQVITIGFQNPQMLLVSERLRRQSDPERPIVSLDM
jgi:hypothetical protein